MFRLSKELVSYCFVAVLSLAADWLAFVAGHSLGAHPVAAQAIARCVGGVVSFAINRKLSFGHSEGHGLSRESRRFLVLYCASYVLSIGTLTFFISVLDVPVYFAKILSDGTCFLFNFLGMRSYVFAANRGLSDRLTLKWLGIGKSPN